MQVDWAEPEQDVDEDVMKTVSQKCNLQALLYTPLKLIKAELQTNIFTAISHSSHVKYHG